MKKQIMLLLSIALIITESIGFYIALTNHGWALFGMYTQDSNFVMLSATTIFVIYQIMKKHGKIQEIPRWVNIFKYVGTGMVTVTFTVVLLVLAPMCYKIGGKELAIWVIINDASLYHHLICPILALVIFLGFEENMRLTVKDNIIATIPTAIYAVVTTSLNVANVIKGPYPFLYVYEQPVWQSVMWFFIIPAGGYIFAYIIRKINTKYSK